MVGLAPGNDERLNDCKTFMMHWWRRFCLAFTRRNSVAADRKSRGSVLIVNDIQSSPVLRSHFPSLALIIAILV